MKHITHLIEATEFILQSELYGAQHHSTIKSMVDYAKFLKTPLTLSMFVPANSEGAIKEPVYSITNYGASPAAFNRYEIDLQEYNQAKENVLFEGFEFNRRLNDYKGSPDYRFNYNSNLINITFDKTVEYLIMLNLKLTPAALKMIYNY